MNKRAVVGGVVGIVALTGILLLQNSDRQSEEVPEDPASIVSVKPTPKDAAKENPSLSPSDEPSVSSTSSDVLSPSIADEVSRIESVESSGVIVLTDLNGQESVMSSTDLYTRRDLVAEFGWSEDDVMSENDVFNTAAKFLRYLYAESSTGNLDNLNKAAALAIGEARTQVDGFIEAAKVWKPSQSDIDSPWTQSVETPLTWAPRGLEQYGQTSHDSAVLAVNYELTSSLYGKEDSVRTQLLTITRTGDGWKVSKLHDVDFGSPNDPNIPIGDY